MSYETSPRPLRRWLETACLSALGLIAVQLCETCAAVRGEEVAGWLVLLPVLCGAQHGMLYGIVSAALLCAAPVVGPALLQRDWPAARGLELVYVSAGAIAGMYRDVSARRSLQQGERTQALVLQLERTRRNLRTIQLSHDQLAQRFFTQPIALASLLERSAQRARQLESLPALAELMLEVLAAHASLQAAVLLRCHAGRIVSEPLARLGEVDACLHEHPLVQRAAVSGQLVTVLEPDSHAHATAGVLAAVPVRSACQKLTLVLVVQQLPFEAFHADALRSVHALAAELCDIVLARYLELAPAPARASQREPPAALSRLKQLAD